MAANSSKKPTLMLVDGHSLAFRSYYAFAKNADGGLRTSTGIPTSVCYGFLKSLLDMMDVRLSTRSGCFAASTWAMTGGGDANCVTLITSAWVCRTSVAACSALKPGMC